jgi:holo-[acyl-carrier protein] synthase
VHVRIGTDLVAVPDVQAAIESFASRYLDRVYTPAEQADCRTPDGAPDAARLAARFAAKEAALKALRAGDAAVPWTAVEVRRLPDGAPELHVTGAAAALAERAGASELAVSLSHEAGLATAVVVVA